MFVIINRNTNDVVGTCSNSSFNAGSDFILVETALSGDRGFEYDGVTLREKAPDVPVLPLTNLVIANPAKLVGDIYWLAKDTDAVITGELALPDGDYMIMAERVINATTVVDDVRFVSTVANGVFTMTVNFPIPGNYLLSAKRMNEGLDRISSPVHLSFDDVEFDVFV